MCLSRAQLCVGQCTGLVTRRLSSDPCGQAGARQKPEELLCRSGAAGLLPRPHAPRHRGFPRQNAAGTLFLYRCLLSTFPLLCCLVFHLFFPHFLLYVAWCSIFPFHIPFIMLPGVPSFLSTFPSLCCLVFHLSFPHSLLYVAWCSIFPFHIPFFMLPGVPSFFFPLHPYSFLTISLLLIFSPVNPLLPFPFTCLPGIGSAFLLFGYTSSSPGPQLPPHPREQCPVLQTTQLPER